MYHRNLHSVPLFRNVIPGCLAGGTATETIRSMKSLQTLLLKGLDALVSMMIAGTKVDLTQDAKFLTIRVKFIWRAHDLR